MCCHMYDIDGNICFQKMIIHMDFYIVSIRLFIN